MWLPYSRTLRYLKLKNDVTLCNRTNLNVDDIMELLEFICSTTYFTFDGTIMQQKFGPVSAVIANFYMEKLERKALQTTPAEYRPKIWKRYLDDVLDVIKKDQVKNFTDHLNSIDDTNSIKFTYEEETNGVIPFFDLLINRQPDKTVKIQVYRKPTHTDQYLHIQSHHPIHHKSGVVRTLMDTKDTLVSTEDDQDRVELHIRNALKSCGYPKWIFDEVKHDQCQKRKKTVDTNKRNKSVQESKGLAVSPVGHNRSCSESNHVINWSCAKILEREGHRKTRQVKESIWIRKEPNCMNRDGGA